MEKKEVELCDPYAWEDPRYLFRLTWLTKRNAGSVCASEYVNEIIVVWLVVFLVGVSFSAGFGTMIPFLLLLVLGNLYLLPAYRALYEKHPPPPPTTSTPVEEGFVGEDILGAPITRSVPNAANPFQNPMLYQLPAVPGERIFAPGPAEDITTPERKEELDMFFRTLYAADPTDVFGRSQSQREFYTVPGSTIPNDQGSYQNWLYRIPGKTCKEGGRANCLPGTQGAAIPWLNTSTGGRGFQPFPTKPSQVTVVFGQEIDPN
jgi:hypothetical protein